MSLGIVALPKPNGARCLTIAALGFVGAALTKLTAAIVTFTAAEHTFIAAFRKPTAALFEPTAALLEPSGAFIELTASFSKPRADGGERTAPFFVPQRRASSCHDPEMTSFSRKTLVATAWGCIDAYAPNAEHSVKP